jgi:hypothetical protein
MTIGFVKATEAHRRTLDLGEIVGRGFAKGYRESAVVRRRPHLKP